MTFLEQLAAEWFRFRGYFVETNVKFGKRPEGGWKGEMDVAAFDPRTRELVHVETSGDANSWTQRRQRFGPKFRNALAHHGALFRFPIRSRRRLAIVGYATPRRQYALGEGIRVQSIPAFVSEIAAELRNRNAQNQMVPETFPLLRAMQFALWWGTEDGEE